MAEKTPNQQLAEKLLFKPAYVGDKSAAVKQEAHAFAEGYKKFLDAGKTEREVAAESEQMLKDAGYQQFDPKKTYAPGDKVYFSQLGKAIVASTIGTRSFEDGFDRVKAMFAKVGLPEDVLNKYPHELSGGQQQRVGIATALITSPRLIIADEPTTALDSITQRQIVDLLTSLVDDSGASMLFITHDFSVLRRATTRCYVLSEGHVVESGATSMLLECPTTPEATNLVRAARELSLDVEGGR